MRDPEFYLPPLVTETDEARWDDCVPASTLMLVTAWTLGEALDRPSGEIMPRSARKRLRERMRDHLPADKQRGGLTVADAIDMVALEWPDLPTLTPYRRSWDAFWSRLQAGWCAVLWGNPVEVAKPSSPLRRWTADDDFGHALFVARAVRGETWVMDPLGSGAYRGQWVPEAQLRQFAYLEAGDMRSCLMAAIGDQSAAARAGDIWAERLMQTRARHVAEEEALRAQLLPIDDARAASRVAALDEAMAAIAGLSR